jgi:hypothetical protein
MSLTEELLCRVDSILTSGWNAESGSRMGGMQYIINITIYIYYKYRGI